MTDGSSRSIDGPDNCFGVASLGALDDIPGDRKVGVGVDLLKGDLRAVGGVVVLGGTNLLDGLGGIHDLL